MYILIKDDVPPGFAVLAAAHASLAGYLKFKQTPEVIEWLSGPFYKTVCRVSDTEFERAKEFSEYVDKSKSDFLLAKAVSRPSHLLFIIEHL